jgi:hypothetical protein
MPRHSGKSGKVFAQVGGGTLISWTALTDDGTHRKFSSAAGQYPWKDNPQPQMRIDGVRNGCNVVPDPAGADNLVAYTDGNLFLAGAPVGVTGALSTEATRPAVAGNVVINAATIDSTGAFAWVAGIEGTAGGARGATGGPPYVPAGSILLAEVTLTTDADAPIAAAEIDTSCVERADIPGWTPNHYSGYITTQLPLEAIHTSDLPRSIYGQWRTTQLAEVFDLQSWDLDTKHDTAETNGFGDHMKTAVQTIGSWSGKISGFFTSPFWFELSNRGGYCLLKLRTSEDDQYEWVGLSTIDWGIKVSATAAVTEDISFTGAGQLELLPVLE